MKCAPSGGAGSAASYVVPPLDDEPLDDEVVAGAPDELEVELVEPPPPSPNWRTVDVQPTVIVASTNAVEIEAKRIVILPL
jgi:hypothetical protein